MFFGGPDWIRTSDLRFNALSPYFGYTVLVFLSLSGFSLLR